MKNSFGQELLYSKFFKGLITFTMLFLLVATLWDLYKFIYFIPFDREKIIDDLLLLFLSFILYIGIVKQPSKLYKFLRTKIGILISWTLIIVFVVFTIPYPFNFILSVLLLSFPAMHYTIRYIGQRKKGQTNRNKL